MTGFGQFIYLFIFFRNDHSCKTASLINTYWLKPDITRCGPFLKFHLEAAHLAAYAA